MQRFLEKIRAARPAVDISVAEGQLSFSQSGEDAIVDYIFSLKKVFLPSYLDIGAFHPWHLNNTARFYRRGCRGINVEPNPTLHRVFEQARPDDVNLNMGIASAVGRRVLFVMEDSTLSTFSQEEKNHLIASGHRVASTCEVEVRTVSDILKRHSLVAFPDFLSLDVEGLEEEILQDIDYKRNAPKVICVETSSYSPVGRGKKRSGLIEYLLAHGFEIYADTNLNTVFVRSDFWKSDE